MVELLQAIDPPRHSSVKPPLSTKQMVGVSWWCHGSSEPS
jgi:hypothetical protein